jgi:hypothetical protein
MLQDNPSNVLLLLLLGDERQRREGDIKETHNKDFYTLL